MATPFRPHVLVVDDDPGIHEALAVALRDRYAVHTAASGAEALPILRSYPIAAIILDAILHDEHGLDLVTTFRAIAPVPILILTGQSTEELAIRALWARVDGYLKKPPTLHELHTALESVLPRDTAPSPLAARARVKRDARRE